MALGLLLGVAMWQLQPGLHKPLIASRALLAVILFLTGTRAVIAILVLTGLLMLLQSSLSWKRRVAWSTSIIVVVIIGAVATQNILAHRLTSGDLANQSLHYRFALQHFAVKASLHEPLFGYGPGSLSTPLACPTLHNPALQLTCHQGYYFDSSHNVFLDRVLALGWVGGISFSLFVLAALYKGLRTPGMKRYCSYAALLIAAYYLTNPSDLTIELLFWVFLLQPYKLPSLSHASASP
jgi:O-antigen ligase